VSPLTLSFIAFVFIICGITLGALLRRFLPGHHLAEDSRDIIRLGSGVIATIAALVLGLLTSSAKSSFDTQRTQIKQIAANVVSMDFLLAAYGPEARELRVLLRGVTKALVDRLWQENSGSSSAATPFQAASISEFAYSKLQGLVPQNDAQRSIKDRVIQLANEIIQLRLTLFEEADSSIPSPFLAVLVFWLTIIFASFSLFSRLNVTAVTALLIFALSACGALFLILDMDQPFTGFMRISSAPLRNALAPLPD
jgi:hypothetical protein